MSKKTLNTANLERLGASKLAKLVMELVKGDAALQRQARLALSAAQGPKDIARDLRKRFATIRRARSHVDWRSQKALVKDLDGLLTLIETSVLPDDPQEGFELLWEFIQLSPSLQERIDDSNGAIGGIMAGAVDVVAKIAPQIQTDPTSLAQRMLLAIIDAGYGEFDGIIPALAQTLGAEGLAHLKHLTNSWATAEPTQEERDEYRKMRIYYPQKQTIDDVRTRILEQKRLTQSVILADIADAQGDVNAYMARYTAEQLTYGTIAPDVARRLLDANRVEEAFQIINNAFKREKETPRFLSRAKLDPVYEECLERMGQHTQLKTHLWQSFEQFLSARALKKYLKLLPDFEDMEAEEKALRFAKGFENLQMALRFLMEWNAYQIAADMILIRADELDGNRYEVLTDAAKTLAPEHPLAASLMYRAMISDTLKGAKSKRYGFAARHLASCQALAPMIADFASWPSHAEFAATLKEEHARKQSFWSRVKG